MKIGIYNKNLDGTGAPRVLIALAESFHNYGHEVFIFVDSIKNSAFDIPQSIKVYEINKNGIKFISEGLNSTKKFNNHSLKNIFNRIINKIKSILDQSPLSHTKLEHLRQSLEIIKPDFILNNNILENFEYQDIFEKVCPSILCVHMEPKALYSRTDISHEKLKKHFNNRYVVSVSKDASKNIKIIFPNVKKSFCVYNISNRDQIRDLAKESVELKHNLPENFYIYIGSLTKRKRVDRLIKTIAKMPSIENLVILGEGHQLKPLKSLSRILGVSEQVFFIGFLKNPYPILSRAKALLISSEAEGLPTVIIEALQLNIPAISTNCPSGPSEILINNFRDLIVSIDSEDLIINQFKDKLINLKKFKNEDYEEACARFSTDSIINKWNNIFKEIHKDLYQ